MTPDERRQALIQEMLPAALKLVDHVHELSIPGVAEVLNPLLASGDRERIAAVLIALAGMVNPHAGTRDLLAWLDVHPRQEQLPYGDLSAASGEKRCPVCGIRPLHEFGLDRSRRDGRAHRCRSCECKRKQNRRTQAAAGEAAA